MNNLRNLSRIERNEFGRLVYVDSFDVRHVGVYPVRAFPITAPDSGICLMDDSGKELLWFQNLDAVPDCERGLLEEELAVREFMPFIERILKVSSFATPSIWDIETDRGSTRIKLKGEEDIRRIAGNALLIADANGLQFLIRDSTKLDKVSKKLLDRFR